MPSFGNFSVFKPSSDFENLKRRGNQSEIREIIKREDWIKCFRQLSIPQKCQQFNKIMTGLRRSTRITSLKRKHDEEEIDKDVTVKKAITKPKKVTKEPPAKIETAKKETVSTSELEVGDNIPDLTLENQDGVKISLKKVAKDKKILVIFTYPKASTPGCTRQVCGFRDNYQDLKSHAAVYGLSADSASAQKKFQLKQSLPYDLLSDPKRELIGLLGAKKTPQSGIIRSHFIFVDGKLKFKRIKISPEVSVSEGKKEVLELVEKFKNK